MQLLHGAGWFGQGLDIPWFLRDNRHRLPLDHKLRHILLLVLRCILLRRLVFQHVVWGFRKQRNGFLLCGTLERALLALQRKQRPVPQLLILRSGRIRGLDKLAHQLRRTAPSIHHATLLLQLQLLMLHRLLPTVDPLRKRLHNFHLLDLHGGQWGGHLPPHHSATAQLKLVGKL